MMDASLLVTPLYAGICGILLILLSITTIQSRRHHKIALHHEDNQALLRAVRAHGNFVEYVPFTLFLLLLCELNGAALWQVHLIGGLLLSGRLIHAYSLLHGEVKTKPTMRWRTFGMMLTFAAILKASLVTLAQFIFADQMVMQVM